MNFIKGYRYEMYCIARCCKSTRCVVWVDTPISAIESFNKSCSHYSEEVLQDLACRFEPPSPLTRWDTPLFRVCGVEESSLFENPDATADSLRLGLDKQSTVNVPVTKEVPMDALWESLTSTKSKSKHIAVNPPVLNGSRVNCRRSS